MGTADCPDGADEDGASETGTGFFSSFLAFFGLEVVLGSFFSQTLE